MALPASAGVVQLTSDLTYGSGHASISADGSKVAFESSADLTGGNSDHSDEIFVINSDGTGLLQLTSATDPMNESSWSPSISGDGSVVVFVSSADLVTGQNGDGTLEVFLVNSDGTGMQQLTSDAVWSCDMPAISADGSKVVFTSHANWTGGNADGSSEIFVIDSNGSNLTRLTGAPLGSDSCCMPSISADGSKVVFQSDAVLIGSANLDKSMEIFAVNSNGTGLTQLTNQSSASYWCCMSAISGDGSKVTFASDADLTTGNSDHSEEIFVINSVGTGLAQLTSDSDVSNDSDDPSINADGSVVVFESSADLTGANADFSDEIFKINSDGTGLQQLTSASPASIDSQNPSISADGLKVVFDSEADLTGGNSDNNEDIFLVTLGGSGAGGTPWIQLEYLTPLTPTSVPMATDYTEPAFGDVDADFWAWAQIEECAATHTESSDFIVQGYGSGTYEPALVVTRGMMAVFIARAAGYTSDVSAVSFKDVPDTYWAYEEIEQCVTAEVVKGYADYFGEDDPETEDVVEGGDAYLPSKVVDRGQMAVYIYRAAALSTAAYQGLFEDVDEDFWAALEIEACADADIVQGYGTGIGYLP
ncbi:MAG: S-layer homology domain-containing protein, partial [Armatimonadota bacterium]|nr:S-layer homology domain-containing protein [Armatimonadota bacterium]